jgi:hypothetical protein
MKTEISKMKFDMNSVLDKIDYIEILFIHHEFQEAEKEFQNLKSYLKSKMKFNILKSIEYQYENVKKEMKFQYEPF